MHKKEYQILGKGISTRQRKDSNDEKLESFSVPRTMIDTQWGGGAVPINKSSFEIKSHNQR